MFKTSSTCKLFKDLAKTGRPSPEIFSYCKSTVILQGNSGCVGPERSVWSRSRRERRLPEWELGPRLAAGQLHTCCISTQAPLGPRPPWFKCWGFWGFWRMETVYLSSREARAFKLPPKQGKSSPGSSQEAAPYLGALSGVNTSPPRVCPAEEGALSCSGSARSCQSENEKSPWKAIPFLSYSQRQGISGRLYETLNDIWFELPWKLQCVRERSLPLSTEASRRAPHPQTAEWGRRTSRAGAHGNVAQPPRSRPVLPAPTGAAGSTPAGNASCLSPCTPQASFSGLLSAIPEDFGGTLHPCAWASFPILWGAGRWTAQGPSLPPASSICLSWKLSRWPWESWGRHQEKENDCFSL